MGLLGLLSLIQIGFLPGYLVVSMATKKLSLIDKALLALPLSAVVNYCLVVLATLLGIYTQILLLVVMAAELLIFLWLSKNAVSRDGSVTEIRFRLTKTNVIVSIVALAYLIGAWKQVGTVFVDGDAVASWDRWAEDWFRGEFPHSSYYYPQLLPALYSITYQFIGTADIKLFSKLVPVFFVLATLATYLRVANLIPRFQKAVLWAFVLLAFVVTRTMGSTFPFNGYADYPLIYFTLVIGYCFILLYQQREDNEGRRLFLMMCFLAAGAAVTKQSGMYIAAIAPLAWYWHIGRIRYSAAQSFIMVGQGGAIIFVVAVSWYLYKYLQIHLGGDTSNLAQLSGWTPIPMQDRIPYALSIMAKKLSWLWLVLVMVGATVPLGRWLLVWVGVPYFFLWALFVPYDFRNLALALVPLTFAMALGIEVLRVKSQTLVWLKKAIGVLGFGLAIIICIELASPSVTASLVENAKYAQRKIGNQYVNEKLYAFLGVQKMTTRFYRLAIHSSQSCRI